MPIPRPFAALIGLSLAGAASAAGAAQSIHVDLTEPDAGGMAIMVRAGMVPAGTTTSEVSNKAAGAVHEFLVARLTTDPDKVPFNDTTGTVKEDMLQDVVELGDLEPGRSGTIDLDLKPGKYLMFCNLPGHYQAGMYRVLTVTQ